MRVISGKYKGRILKGFSIEGTRPTMDRVKESLFGMIQNKIKNAIVLDLFAGSGNLGIEALSNGAKEGIFVDKNIICTKTIEENIKTINIEEKTLILNKDYKLALKDLERANKKVDIVFLDPPYHENILNDALMELVNYNILEEKALIIVEYERETPNCSLNLLKEKRYGDKNIKMYEYKNL